MSLRGAMLVLLAAVLTAAGNLLMRGGVRNAGGLGWELARQPVFLSGAVLYGAAALVWFAVLAAEDLSTSYPVLVSVVFLLVTAGAALFFHERVTGQKLLGLAVILGGIVLVARS